MIRGKLTPINLDLCVILIEVPIPNNNLLMKLEELFFLRDFFFVGGGEGGVGDFMNDSVGNSH